ncbi:hypothetical protein ACSBR2_038609 [Camellia fascicularis]
MYNNLGAQPGVSGPPPNPQPNSFGNAFVGAGSGLIRGLLGADGEKILGSNSEYVQSNITRYFSDPQYYFQVNDHYVRNKLKVILLPFLHRGHWTRITEPVGGRLSYKPPIYDVNAPDVYIPFMVFGTRVLLAGFSLGLHGKQWGGAPAGHSGICRVYFHRYVSGCLGKNHVELLILLFDAMGVLVHGNPLGKDNEESSFCGGEDL